MTCRRTAMTLLELMLVYLILALLLGLLVGLGGYVRREAKRRLAADMLLTLREALLAFHVQNEFYPRGRKDGAAAPALNELIAEERSLRVLRNWPIELPPAAITPRLFVDPWARPFRYITAANADRLNRERVLSGGGMPVFETAGPDGDFGDDDLSATVDNIASDTAVMLWHQ